MQAALSFKNFKAETGANIEELQRWQAVADETSGAGQAVAESIKAISKNTADIKLGKGNISGFQLLGISPNQDPFKILDQLRTKTAGLSQAMKRNVLEQMGVSKDLIQTLELTNEEFQKISSNAFIVPQDSINQIDAARKSTEQLKNGMKYFGMELTAQLAPAIIKINTAITEWIRKNKDGLIKDLKTVFEWIVKFVGAGVNTVKMINAVVSGTIGWANAFTILIAVIAILNASLLLSPIGWITAGIILLVAVLDDLYVYSHGGKSLLGTLDKDNGLRKMADNLLLLSSTLKDLINGDFSKFDKLVERMGAFGAALKIAVHFLDDMQSLLSNFTGNEEAYMKTKRGKQTVADYEEIRKIWQEKGQSAAWLKWVQQGMSVDIFNFMKAGRNEDFFSNRKSKDKGDITINNRTEVNVHGDLTKEGYDEIRKQEKAEHQKQLNSVDAQLGYGEN